MTSSKDQNPIEFITVNRRNMKILESVCVFICISSHTHTHVYTHAHTHTWFIYVGALLS